MPPNANTRDQRHASMHSKMNKFKTFNINETVIREGYYVAAEVRAASVAVVDIAVGGVEQSSVEVVAGTLTVELTTSVGQVKLLDNSEHDIVCKNCKRL